MMGCTKVFESALCSATETATPSEFIDISRGAGNFAINCAASTSAADINIGYQASDDAVNASAVVAIKDAFDGVYLVEAFSAPSTKFIRFTATGDGTNPAGTTLSVNFTFTEL